LLSVAITGMGVVAAAGTKQADLRAGSGVGKWLLAVDGRLDLSPHLDALQVQAFDRSSQLAVVAAKLALEDAGGASCPPQLLGVCLANTYGCLGPQIALDRVILTEGPQAVSGSLFPYGAFNAAAANVAIVLHARGPNFTLATGSAAGTDACTEAARQVQGGRAVCMLAGGVEAPGDDLRCWLGKLGFDPTPTEGAAVLMLESHDEAVRRGARIHGWITGAASSVMDDDSRASLERAAASCARSALEEGSVLWRDIRLVVGDVGLLVDLFEQRAVPAHVAESTFGETLSASGAFQVVLGALFLGRQTERGPVLCISRSLEGIVSALVVTP
jgi:3-oxoacyl-[acyl-carrier-protein] synthase II